ncbi:MAG TPA: prolipoprotein diacylglyceryl transferase [Cytophagaceae bacterium]|jgi:prolipoprotein diacylglyceryltransferase
MPFFEFILWNASPEIFQIGSFPLRWYGLLFASGFLIGQQILIRIYKQEGKSEKHVETLTLYMIIATVVGARLGHCLFYQPDYYLKNPIEILKIWEGGLASHGATLGILIAIYIYSKKTTGQSYLYVLDRLVITIALAGCLIRIGNLMNSEIIGKPTNLDTGFIFVNGTKTLLNDHFGELLEDVEIREGGKDTIINNRRYAGLDLTFEPLLNNISDTLLRELVQNKVKDQLLYSSDPDVADHIWVRDGAVPITMGRKEEKPIATMHIFGIPRHPTQLYEALMALCLFFFLFYTYEKTKERTPEGRIFGLFVVLLFSFRFAVEFLKEPQVEFESTMDYNMGQLLSIPLIIVGLFVLIKSYRKRDEIS